MRNTYVDLMREYIKSYSLVKASLDAEMEENIKALDTANRETLSAVEKNCKELRERQAKEYATARERINNVFFTVRELLSKADFLHAEYLTSDKVFFESDSCFMLSVDEVQGFIEKYRYNYTMLRLIRDWISKQDCKYSKVKMFMPFDVLIAYKHFGEGALAFIEKIYDNENIDPNSFGDESIAENLLSIVGDGEELTNYDDKFVPSTIKSIYESVVLTGSDSLYYKQS